MPPFELEEIKHFFVHYKDLEPEKFVEAAGWVGREKAEAEVSRRLSGTKPRATERRSFRRCNTA